MSMGSKSEHLIAVFTKATNHPKIKTRLAADIGTKAARDCYLETLDHTIKTVATGFHGEVYVEGSFDNDDWLHGLPSRPQARGDLGERMFQCFEDGIRVLIGGDCPLITSEYLRAAINELKKQDVVLGPTEDGGYVLIGMTKPHRELFDNMRWGQSQVCEDTLARCTQLNLTTACLPTVWDIDDRSNYERWLQWKVSKNKDQPCN